MRSPNENPGALHVFRASILKVCYVLRLVSNGKGTAVILHPLYLKGALEFANFWSVLAHWEHVRVQCLA